MFEDIKGYELIRQIGTGGFGEVYIARQVVVNREVAIKVILPTYASKPDFIRRFNQEAELVARLEHPFIVPLYDYWRRPEGAYLVMRYMRGGNLADKLTLNGYLSMDEAARLLQQIADALYTAHRQRVIHQDIKPANILLDEDGNAYLTDFGIARDMDRNINLAEDDNKTMHGSPKYISPEHLRRKTITHRSDIYSLGILMYEILTGYPPFEGNEMLDVLQQHVRKPLPSLQEKRPDLPAELNQPIIQATLKDPLQRYDNVMHFARDFQDAVMRAHSNDPTVRIPYRGFAVGEETGPIEHRNPYKGLKPFTGADADTFFGREALINTLKRRLVEDHPNQRFLAIVGRSGSGKSSVVRAGLIPALQKDEIIGLPELYPSEMTPGSNPLRNLESAVLQVASRASIELMDGLASDDFDLNHMLKLALPENGEMLLLVDQFEEIFTLVDDTGVRRRFLDILYQALMAKDSRLRLIITLRADFLDRPLSYEGWDRLIESRITMVLQMSPAELYDAITKPAQQAGLLLEDKLADMIVADTREQPGALPLMQYTLSELFERAEGIELTIKDYRDLGGISGSLVKRAEEIYATLSPAQQQTARVMFSRLVRLGQNRDHTRRRVMRGELYTLPGGQDEFKPVIEIFGKHRLLTFDQDDHTRLPTVEIAHEALIRSWSRLLEWLANNEDALRLQEKLASEVTQWHDAGQDASYLASGLRLESYASLLDHDLVQLNKREQDYLQESIKQEEAQRRQERRRRFIRSLGVAMILLLGIGLGVAGIFAIQARNDEQIARQQAEANARLARAGELAASALLYARNTPDRALLLSLHSLAIADTLEGRSALLTGLLEQPRLEHYYYGHDSHLRAVAVAPDGNRVASASADGNVILWDPETQQPTQQLDGHQTRVNSVAFTPDGSQIASADSAGVILIHDALSGEMIATLAADDEIWKLAFSPDGAWLAAADTEGTIYIYASPNYARIETLEAHERGVYALSFSPDGQMLASGGGDNVIRLWQTGDWQVQESISGHEDWVVALAFSPDSTRLVSGSNDRSIRLWDVRDGDMIWGFNAHSEQVSSVAYSVDGQFVLSGDLGSTIVIWEAERGAVLDNFTNIERAEIRQFATAGNALYVASDTNALIEYGIGVIPRFGTTIIERDQAIQALATTPDGTQLAYAGSIQGDDDFSVTVWQMGRDERQSLVLHTNTVLDLAYDGSRLLSAGLDQRLGVWEDGALLGSLALDDAVFSLAAHEGLVALGLNDGTIELWDLSGDEADWQRRATLESHTDRVNDLAFNADGTRLISGSRDNSARIWDVPSGAVLHVLNGHSSAIEAVDYSPTAEIVATGSRDTTVLLWDASSGELRGQRLDNHSNWVNGLAFNPDGSLLASGSADRSVILWDVREGRILGQPFFGHPDWVNALIFAPDGQRLYSAGRDGTVIAWQTTRHTWETRACEIANRALTPAEISEFFSGERPTTDVCLRGVSDNP